MKSRILELLKQEEVGQGLCLLGLMIIVCLELSGTSSIFLGCIALTLNILALIQANLISS